MGGADNLFNVSTQCSKVYEPVTKTNNKIPMNSGYLTKAKNMAPVDENERSENNVGKRKGEEIGGSGEDEDEDTYVDEDEEEVKEEYYEEGALLCSFSSLLCSAMKHGSLFTFLKGFSANIHCHIFYVATSTRFPKVLMTLCAN